MLPDIENLLRVQDADKEIRRLQEEIAALPRRVAAIEQKLAGHKAALEAAKSAVKADEANRRKYDTAIQDLQGKISKYRDQSLAVKTNDQYKALMQEIQFAEQEIRANEDKILEVMLNTENREKQVKVAETELKAETAEVEKEKAEARERTAVDEKQLADWNGKRTEWRGAVNADLLRRYERVMKFRGSGLAEVRDQKCMGCQVFLRPQTFNELKGGAVLECESCQRVLYYDASKEEPAVAAAAAANHGRRRAHPKSDASQAWFFRPDYGEDGEVLILFQNAAPHSQRSVYDLHTGRQIGNIVEREGNYPLAFPEDLTDAAIRLNGSWPKAEIEEWGSELPMNTIEALQRDLTAALRERSKSKSHAEAVPSHSAAS